MPLDPVALSYGSYSHILDLPILPWVKFSRSKNIEVLDSFQHKVLCGAIRTHYDPAVWIPYIDATSTSMVCFQIAFYELQYHARDFWDGPSGPLENIVPFYGLGNCHMRRSRFTVVPTLMSPHTEGEADSFTF